MADPPTASPGPELSSITSALTEITHRVTTIADRSVGGELDWLASALFEVERSLVDATRRLSTAVTTLATRD